jgi:hypothetical protein
MSTPSPCADGAGARDRSCLHGYDSPLEARPKPRQLPDFESGQFPVSCGWPGRGWLQEGNRRGGPEPIPANLQKTTAAPAAFFASGRSFPHENRYEYLEPPQDLGCRTADCDCHGRRRPVAAGHHPGNSRNRHCTYAGQRPGVRTAGSAGQRPWRRIILDRFNRQTGRLGCCSHCPSRPAVRPPAWRRISSIGPLPCKARWRR